MKLLLLAIGRVKGAFAEPVAAYEARLRRYFPFEVIELKEQPSHQASGRAEVMAEEGKRILARVPAGYRLVALHREGEGWSSERLSRWLADGAVNGVPGAAFAIGGAFGLANEVLDRADQRLSLSNLTLPHEMARLVLTEQLYRAGTIARGEPYHKGGGG